MILAVTGCPRCGEVTLSQGQGAQCEEDHWDGDRALGLELGDQVGAWAILGGSPSVAVLDSSSLKQG